MNWTKTDLLTLDAKYAEMGIHMHQRPFRAAMEILGSGFVLGATDDSEVRRIMNAYAEMIPEVDNNWPGAGIGLCASIDRVRKITLPVAFGSCSVETWQAMNFASRNEWWDWCRQDPDIASRSSFALADLYDFALGINEAEHASPEAATLWHMAQSNLQDISNALPAAFHVDSVIQPICLVAELAMKGTLVWNGVDPNDFRGPAGHDLKGLAKRLAKARPHSDDAAVREVIAKLPPYVQSRYSPQGLTRLDVVRLAMGVQFIAGSMLRRITHVDFAAQMDSGEWPAPRRPFFPAQN
ncbi:TPA: hypothetical protein QDB11_005109 [Burkholderia vietnamiensis]|uniref:hypothetical protein n=1 Tax=Burkholderia vietnamiensis TaxID=60552 RepID=UPI0018C5EAA0|nr:hypothetical protein [Burkholderia vietnamiensis]MDN8115421.1 hypothetical protein [Burkholderia vietnamiensis]HDR9140391.1 hypothetical protein [Burkholderia vietnamiensis]